MSMPRLFPAFARILSLLMTAALLQGAEEGAAADWLDALGRGRLLEIIEGAPAAASPSGSIPSPNFVPIRTRVVSGDGTKATNYSILVGDRRYVAPPMLDGQNQGFHLVILSRSSLNFSSNTSYGTDDVSLALLTEALQAVSEAQLVIFSTIGLPDAIPIQSPAQLLQFQELLENLGGSENAFLNPAAPVLGQIASRYSLIGNLGRNVATAHELSSLVNPNTTGSIEAVLIPDLNGNYFPVYPTFVTVQTSAGSLRDSVMIGDHRLAAPPLPTGASGGFHLVVVRRDRVAEAGTHPEVVLMNSSYGTASANGGTELRRLVTDLNTLAPQINAGSVIVILASLGAASLPPTEDVVTLIEWISALGGVGDIPQLAPDGYYSLLGIPWLGGDAPIQSLENRSWTVPTGATQSPNLTVVMQPGPDGWFAPVVGDTAEGVDYRMFRIALQQPTPWPVAPSASSSPCQPGDEPCLAYHWISQQITANDAILSLREIYTVLDSPFSTYSANLDVLQYAPAMRERFSREVFEQVKQQLGIELLEVQTVVNLLGQYTQLITDFAVEQTGELMSAYSNVEQTVSPDSSSTAGYDLEVAMRTITLIGAAVDPEPVSRAALGVASAGLFLGMSLDRSPAGNSNGQLLAKEGELAGLIVQRFNSNLVSISQVFASVLTDWGRLHEVGTLAQGPPSPGNGFAWTNTTAGRITSSMATAFELSFYKALLPTTFELVVWPSVPFSNPRDYSYYGRCYPNIGYCDCNSDVYSPPSYAFYPTQFSPYQIFMLATPDKRYPGQSLMETNLPSLGVYMPDFFAGAGPWAGVLPIVPPEGWDKYLNSGSCAGNWGSYLRVEHAPGQPSRFLSRSEPGARYQVEWTPSLGTDWQSLGEPVQAGGDRFEVSHELPESPGAFFRLRRLP